MQFRQQEKGKYLLVHASGRLDASWADHFSSTFKEYIRQGQHHILLEASEVSYLSSAGIRALVQVVKSIMAVQGSFQIIRASSFVHQTLQMTGFESWLKADFPDDLPAEDTEAQIPDESPFELYQLNGSTAMQLSVPATWVPWKAFNSNNLSSIRFGHQDFALGIGAPHQSDQDASMHMGEFLVVGGNVIYQPPREGDKPDFLLPEKAYLPEMHCLQALHCTGDMPHLLRFSPKGNKTYFGLGELAEKVLTETGSALAAFVIFAEIDGLVGSSIIQSPGLLKEDRIIPFPDIKEWLSFCGERVFPRQQALIFGMASKGLDGKKSPLLAGSTMHKNLFLHAHAAVFPYLPIESGVIKLKSVTEKLFKGPPPMALLHLLEDSRPSTGLGESTLIRGACWYTAINTNQEDTIWA